MSEILTVIVYAFFGLNILMTAVTALSAFTESTGRDAHNSILLAATSPVAAVAMTITGRELQ